MPVCCEGQIGCASFFIKMKICMVDMQFLHSGDLWLTNRKQSKKSVYRHVAIVPLYGVFMPLCDVWLCRVQTSPVSINPWRMFAFRANA